MEKVPRSDQTQSPRRLKTNLLCIPSLKNNHKNNHSHKSNNKVLSPATLFDRFREAIFRLIMLSTLSSSTSRDVSNERNVSYYAPAIGLNDHRRSEAVADCIEFIKKKKAGSDDEANRDSTSTSSSEGVNATVQHVVFM